MKDSVAVVVGHRSLQDDHWGAVVKGLEWQRLVRAGRARCVVPDRILRIAGLDAFMAGSLAHRRIDRSGAASRWPLMVRESPPLAAVAPAPQGVDHERLAAPVPSRCLGFVAAPGQVLQIALEPGRLYVPTARFPGARGVRMRPFNVSTGLDGVDVATVLGLATVTFWRPNGLNHVIRPQGVVPEPVATGGGAASLDASPSEGPSAVPPPTIDLAVAAAISAEHTRRRPQEIPRRRHQLRRIRLACRLALLGVVTVGGSVGAVADEAPSRRAMAGEAPLQSAPSTVTTAVAGALGSSQAVTIAFAGDIHFEGVLRHKLSASAPGVLAPATAHLASADLTIANLETAVTERGTAQAKRYVFRAPASAFTALAAAGIDVVNVANNHGMDFGPVGLRDTLTAAGSSQVAVVGMGTNAAEAYAPFRTTIRGQRIAVFGATQVLDQHLVRSWTATEVEAGLASAKDVQRLVDEVATTRTTADTVVVFLHWGVEGQRCPSSGQRALAGRLVEAGADIVVGSHSHRLQGAGRLGGAFVAYGLGNFAFYARGGPGADSGVLKVRAAGRRIEGYSWDPLRIADGVARPVPPAESSGMRRAWEGLRGCAGLEP